MFGDHPGAGSGPHLRASQAAALALLAPLALTWPSVAAAQSDVGDETFANLGHPILLAANAALGALTAGVGRWMKGESIREGVGVGLAGGTLGYVGRRIAVQDFGGAGLLGRQVNALGTSLVANAAAARPALSRLDFPIGPVVLRFEPERGPLPAPRVRAWDAAWMISGLLDSRLELDAAESLSAGAPVFHAPAHVLEERAYGKYIGGVIILPMNQRPSTLAHERVHVLQFDQIHGYWGAPLEGWAASALPGEIASPSWVEGGVAAPLMLWLLGEGLSLDPDNRPWEAEADFLASRVAGAGR